MASARHFFAAAERNPLLYLEALFWTPADQATFVSDPAKYMEENVDTSYTRVGVFESIAPQLLRATPASLAAGLNVSFDGEPAVDAGGVTYVHVMHVHAHAHVHTHVHVHVHVLMARLQSTLAASRMYM